jgi:hypothetical protein
MFLLLVLLAYLFCKSTFYLLLTYMLLNLLLNTFAYGLEFTQIHKMSIVLIWYYNIGRSCAGVMTAFLHFVQLEGLA